MIMKLHQVTRITIHGAFIDVGCAVIDLTIIEKEPYHPARAEFKITFFKGIPEGIKSLIDDSLKNFSVKTSDMGTIGFFPTSIKVKDNYIIGTSIGVYEMEDK